MEKLKIDVLKKGSIDETQEIELSVGKAISKELENMFNTTKDDSITISPFLIDPKDLTLSWAVIERDGEKERLTHRITLTPNNKDSI